ncbi:hypothetical protein ACFOGJ_23480 [Marinibaculum pumilum]|uniref:DUF4239 domain-containing protein n=1 Tax=Marinibaculum pumilum TaxID=1766165 RepID=A0ABV7L6H6_9PROT
MDSLIFFDRPWLFQLLVFLLVAGLGLGAGSLLLALLHRRWHREATLLPVASSFAAITTIFALFLGFLASDVWTEKRRATDAAAAEHAALQRYAVFAAAAGAPGAAARAAQERCLRAVVDREWGAGYNRWPDPAAQEALGTMWQAALRLADAVAMPDRGACCPRSRRSSTGGRTG